METDFLVELKPPVECSESELNTFEDLVKAAGEVTEYGLRHRIEDAHSLAFGKTASGEVVGIAALKNPINNYRHSVFKESHSHEEPSHWQSELGWIFVKEEYRGRGLATLLVQELFLCDSPGNVFATAREKNDEIAPLLRKFGFVQDGQAYPSDKGNYNLILNIKPASK